MGDERRRAQRQDMRWEALIINLDGSIIDRCMIVNVSATGARLVLPASVEVPDAFSLLLSREGKVRRQCEVTWRSEKSIGVRFILPASDDDEEISHISEALTRISNKNLVEN
jgi:hypothetical protein